MRHILNGAALVAMMTISMLSLLACGSGHTIEESETCKNRKAAIREEIADKKNLPPERDGEPCGDATTEPVPYYVYACESCADECDGECVLGN